MIVYEYITLTKKRANSKKWEIAERYFTTDERPLTNEPKRKDYGYKYLNAESVEQVKAFCADNELIIMSPMGASMPMKPLNMQTLLEDSARCTHRCSVSGKKVIVAHFAKE